VAVSDPGWPIPHRRWRLRETDPQAVSALESGFGLSATTARVLAARGITEHEDVQAYLYPSLDGLHSPFDFVQMEAAVDRLLAALDRNERILVHGDYDVDGITATVVMVTCLRTLGGDVGYSVSHRLREGYGLNPSSVDRAHEAGAKVLVAVDCGREPRYWWRSIAESPPTRLLNGRGNSASTSSLPTTISRERRFPRRWRCWTRVYPIPVIPSLTWRRLGWLSS